jgi:uncharacterized membrane protein
MNWIVKNFLRGLVIVVPIALTIYLTYEAFVRIDRLLDLRTPGLGFVVAIAGMIAIGALASNFVVRKLLLGTEAIFRRAPLVRLIYVSVKDLLEAFVGDKKRFDRAVAVMMTPDDAVKSLGFITQQDCEFLGLPGHVAVYLPFSYSMAGSLVLVPSERVLLLPAESATVMALAISGGVSRAG